MSKKQKLHWIKITKRLFITLFTFVILLLLILRLPYIQTFLAQKATSYISNKTNSVIQIDKVAFNFFDNICLKGLYAEDDQADTLLYADQITVDIAFFKLFRNIVKIDNIDLESPFIQIKQYDLEEFNFTFLAEAFPSKDHDTTSESNIVFDLNTISINNPKILLKLIASDLTVQASRIFLNLSRFDLNESIFEFDEMNAKNLIAVVENKNKEDSIIEEKNELDSILAFPLKDLSLKAKISNFFLENSRLYMFTEGTKKETYFTPEYLDLKMINLRAKEISLDNNNANIDLQKFEGSFNDTLSIKKLSSLISFTQNQLLINDLKFETTNSKAKIELKLAYDSFANLINQAPNLKIDGNISEFDLLLNELEYFMPSLKTQKEYANVRNKRLKLKTEVTGGLSSLKIKNIYASIGDSELKGNGNISYPTELSKLYLKNLAIKAKADFKDYAIFIDDENLKQQLKQLGNINIDSYVTGDLAEMNISQLKFDSDVILNADFTGKISSLNNTEQLSFDFDINEIKTGKSDLQLIIDSIPSVLDDFDTIVYKGSLTGTLSQFDLEGGFDTSLGQMETSVNLLFNKSYTDATYSGILALDEFQLGKMIDNDSLGNITMKVALLGSGLSANTIDTEVEGIINQIEFNQYKYSDILINGMMKPNKFSGNIKINDKNARVNFKGFVDMNDSIPQFDFNLDVDTLDLYTLNLYDKNLAVHFDMNAAFQGFNLDGILGSIEIDSIALVGKDKQWKTDSLNFTANSENQTRGLTLTSDFLNASVTGNYTLAKLPETILDFMDQYFPLKSFLGSSPKEDPILSPAEKKEVSGENIQIKIGWHNVEQLLQIFDIPVTKMDSSYFIFNLSAPENLTDLEFSIPFLNYDGYGIDSIYVKGKNTANEKIDLLFRIDSIQINPEMHIADFQTDFIFSENQAKAIFLIKADTNEKTLGGEVMVRSDDTQRFLLLVNETFYLNNRAWKVKQDSSITIKGGQFDIPNFLLYSNSESLSIKGNNKSLNAEFTNFNLQNITEIIKMDSLDIYGTINGDAVVDLQNNNNINSDLTINNVYFNELEIGDFDLDVTKKEDEISSLILVNGESIQLESNIAYIVSQSEFKGDIDLNKFNLAAIDPFVSAYAQNVKGNLEGNIRLNGTIEKPNVMGRINISNVSAYINALETEYRIKEGKLDLYEDKIAPNVTLEDNKKRTANLGGVITHNFFKSLRLDLDFNADEFIFLDSKKSRKADFYGKFVGKIDATITGPLEKPVVTAGIKALKNTDVTLQLLSGAKAVSNENYIIFYDGNKLSPQEAVDSLGKALYTSDQGIEMNLDIQTDPKALFHVIVDPLTGDKLDIRGTSNIFVKLPTSGDVNIVGDFTVKEGQYRLSYENTIKRNFSIEEGSKIRFEGSPYSAVLDMRAIYTTKTNTYSLVNQMGTSLEDGSASNRTTIEVVLYVGGTLSKPELSFDIQVPDNDSGALSNSVAQALTALRQNETQLIEQVFSLILFNSFIGGSSGSNISSVGTASAVSSLGNLINSQLNKLSKNESGFKLNIDVDQYKDAEISDGKNITEIGVGLEQNLFNDKLNISVGGNANLETGNQSQNNFSSFAGDFVIRYYLTDEKNVLVKVFQKSDFDALSNDSVWKTGIGLTYKKTFGNKKTIKNE